MEPRPSPDLPRAASGRARPGAGDGPAAWAGGGERDRDGAVAPAGASVGGLRGVAGRARVWWRATRPHSFAASLVPIAVGGASAGLAGAFSPTSFGLALAGSVCIQAGANLVNDYHDWRSGADAVGPAGRTLRERLLEPLAVRDAGLLALGLGSAAGLVLVARVGWPILALGLAGVPLAYAYTAPPLKLAYRGLGETLVFVLMGPLMVLGGYLVHRPVQGVETALVASLPVGCLVAGILQVNNIRDIELDRASGKRTLATRVGPLWARREYDLLLGGAYVAVAGAVALRVLPWPSLLVLLTLPEALRLRALVRREQAPEALAPAVPRAAGLHLRFGLLLAAGLTAGALLGWR